MFFFFPYTTDAPVYYWPCATVGIIAVNIVIFFLMVLGLIDPIPCFLSWGNGLHPEQWLTSVFTHGGLGHLLGNMLFLWVFGLVVEGKLGWSKFLACYLGIGMTHAMLEQIVMLGYNGDMIGSLGASAAIFGLIAMAAVWAPKNEITFFWFAIFRSGTFEISIMIMAAAYVGYEVLMASIFGGDAGTSLLHLTGFAVGLPLGIVLLKRGVVDCEGWDIFHVWKGDYGAFRTEPDPIEELRKIQPQLQQREAAQLDAAKAQLATYLQQGNRAAAVRLYEKMKHLAGGWKLQRHELMAIIQALHAETRWRDSAQYMAEAIERFPDSANAVRVKLAQICVVELGRPGKALDILREVDLTSTTSEQDALVKRITAKARQMQLQGVIEFDNDEW
jgi:membrane associated rhomboid family serine protease